MGIVSGRLSCFPAWWLYGHQNVLPHAESAGSQNRLADGCRRHRPGVALYNRASYPARYQIANFATQSALED